jgi:hypothetical protein
MKFNVVSLRWVVIGIGLLVLGCMLAGCLKGSNTF